jgi:hypothetical protein
MDERYKKRRETMLKKLGSEEALSQHYRNMQKKANKKGKPGGWNDSETQKKIALKRWNKSREVET